MVIRQHAAVLRGLKGYEKFDADQFADQLLNYSEMLVLFAHANSGDVITDDASEDQKATIQQKRRLALHGDGEVVEIGYNRSRWPTRVADELAVRYYFTLDGATKLDQVRATAECSGSKPDCNLKQDKSGRTFVEVTLTEKNIYPGDRDKQTDFQRFNLRVEAPSWDNENDWSHHKMNTDVQLLPRFVVTVHGELHGQIPSAGIRD